MHFTITLHITIPIGIIYDHLQSTSKARTSFGPWKFVRDIGSSSHWGLIIVSGQEANEDNPGTYFRSSIK